MAPSLTSSERLRGGHAQWSGEDVSLDDVLNQLNQLRGAVASRGIGDYELPRPRNSVMNLVAIAADQQQADRAAVVAEELGGKHPSRTIVVEPQGGKGERIDCTIRSHAHELLGGAPVQYEEIRLRVWGTRARLRSLVEPLLAPDVRTHLWYLATPPWEAEAFLEVLPQVDTLVVDSGSFERAYDSFLAYSRIAESMRDPQGTGDFQWVRLKPWRELLAQCFAPPDRRPLLDAVRSVALDYTGEGRGNRGAAALLAGWLICRLDWELDQAQGGQDRAIYRTPAGEQVEITMRAVPIGASGEGRIAALRLQSNGGDEALRLEIKRDPKSLERADLDLGIGDSEPIEQEVGLGLATASDAELLSELLVSGRRDPIYVSSLRCAAELLRAL